MISAQCGWTRWPCSYADRAHAQALSNACALEQKRKAAIHLGSQCAQARQINTHKTKAEIWNWNRFVSSFACQISRTIHGKTFSLHVYLLEWESWLAGVLESRLLLPLLLLLLRLLLEIWNFKSSYIQFSSFVHLRYFGCFHVFLRCIALHRISSWRVFIKSD